MAAPHPSASPSLGPSTSAPRDRTAESLYAWCCENYPVGHVFNQADLLAPPIIPDKDINVLLHATTDLVRKNLFKLHDLKAGGGIGWELISQERAANYTGLSRDEHLVYSCIDSMGAAGIWTKTIKARLQAHAKVLDRVYKSLESKGLIKPMKSVKNPGRKMFIVAGLQPNEEATGGAWFSDGRLDRGLLDVIAQVIELFISSKSWVETQPPDTAGDAINNKRKTPHGGFDLKGKGKSKAARIDDDQPRSLSPELKHHKSKHRPHPQKSFTPFQAGYQGYPTLPEITRHILQTKITQVTLPENAIAQLLEVMVYDGLLSKVSRPVIGDEDPDDHDNGTITMYRCFKTPPDLYSKLQVVRKANNGTGASQKAAIRQIELEDIGRGGASEVPCNKCAVFDLCGDGGPVNVTTCPYFDEWYVRTAEADQEAERPWPDGDNFIEHGSAKRRQREEAIIPKVKVEGETAVDLT